MCSPEEELLALERLVEQSGGDERAAALELEATAARKLLEQRLPALDELRALDVVTAQFLKREDA